MQSKLLELLISTCVVMLVSVALLASMTSLIAKFKTQITHINNIQQERYDDLFN